MNQASWPGSPIWAGWQKLLFRFAFVYLAIYIAPWTWIEYIPGGEKITGFYYQLMDLCVQKANSVLFHVRATLVPINGSGDTSWAWTQLWLLLCVAAIASVIWTIADRNRKNYNLLAYWFRLVLRYFIIINCFGYGIIKLFGLQMTYPSVSQLATPLGDFLPMRFSWMFMGYSLPYQAFTGAMEVLAGLFMLYRKSAFFGTLLAAGVFAHVMIMNLSYDIPVKLYSTHLFLCCLVLVAFDYRRLIALVFNRANTPSGLYEKTANSRWVRIARVVVKVGFVLVTVILPVKDSYDQFKARAEKGPAGPIREGYYAVETFVRNQDTIPYSLADDLRWHDCIFEGKGLGSIGTTDTTFRQRYHRGYFQYDADTVARLLKMWKGNLAGNGSRIFSLQYEIADSNRVVLKGQINNDSLYIVLRRLNRHFQLTEQQFHWLSEYNR
jgi:hypothetical protein